MGIRIGHPTLFRTDRTFPEMYDSRRETDLNFHIDSLVQNPNCALFMIISNLFSQPSSAWLHLCYGTTLSDVRNKSIQKQTRYRERKIKT